MFELELALSEITDTVNKALELVVSLLKQIVSQIGNEVGVFMTFLAYNFDYMLVEVVNALASFSDDSWFDVTYFVESFSSYMYELSQFFVQRINQTIQNFNQISNAILLIVQQQLNQIDNNVSEIYQQRVFAIYGDIGRLSIAINAPPSYLEDAIQNARIFVLGVSAYVGLSYDKFQMDWYIGLNNLLVKISNTIVLYRQNPQQIRIDLENLLIKPAFEIKFAAVKRKAEQSITIINDILELNDNSTQLRLSILENKQALIDLWTLTIQPELQQIRDDFDKWDTEVFQERVKWVDNTFAFMSSMLLEHWEKLDNIFERLRFGGDILQAIDLLPTAQQLEQEGKIAEVSSRTFRRTAEGWMDFVRGKQLT